MNEVCQGPCLEHCYNNKMYYYIFIGVIIGYVLCYFINNINKEKNKS